MNFSVLMSVFSGESPRFFEDCLASLATQTLLGSEVVLVEDGELPSELLQIIEKYRKLLNIVSVKIPVNKGLGNALNIGLNNCQYPLVARMDTDDIAVSTRFEKQVEFFNRNKSVDILGSAAIDIDKDNNIHGNIRVPPETSEDIIKYLWACPIIHPSVMYKKSLIQEVGSYSLDLKRRQDYDLWFRCAKSGAVFHNLSEPLLKYRVLETSYRKNSFLVAIEQAKIGLKGSFSLRLGILAYVGVCFPIIKAIVPTRLREFIIKGGSRFDPRVRNK